MSRLHTVSKPRFLSTALLAAAAVLQLLMLGSLQPTASGWLSWQAALAVSVLLCLSAWTLQRRAATTCARALQTAADRLAVASQAVAAAEARLGARSAKHQRTI
ncbi:MAG: hypothetical protein ABIN96_11830, partial [Rubrivivax sp.]